MADTKSSREEDLRQLLTEAVEVQLAALKAGIGFWSEWIEQTTAFVESAAKTLSTIKSEDIATKDVLLELVDAGRANVRAMTEIPRHTATKFIEELDQFARKSEGKKAAKAPRAPARSKSAGGSSRPRRAGKAKA